MMIEMEACHIMRLDAGACNDMRLDAGAWQEMHEIRDPLHIFGT